MSALQLMAAGVLVVGLSGGGRAQEKAGNKDKLVGTWEAVRLGDNSPPVGSVVVVFAKDGTMKMTVTAPREETVEGTYSVQGDRLTTALKLDGSEVKATVPLKKLTATEMVGVDDKGKAAEFKRKK